MKKLVLALSLMLVGVSISYAQIAKITPKKTVYTRKGKDLSKEKRTFVITYPVVSGAIPATKKTLEKTISYWRVFETSLKENLEESWLYNAFYTVNYNKNGILDIALTQEGSAAYPDEQTVNLTVNLKTGEQAEFDDVFKADSRAAFAELVDAKLKIEAGEVIKSIDKGEFGENGKEADDSLKEQLGALNFTAETFNEYSINDKGVIIIYDAGFPHVVQAAQPNGRYFFAWAEVKPFIKPDGLLGKFVR